MEHDALSKAASKLIAEAKFQEAEQMLLQAYRTASDGGDDCETETVLRLLVQLYCSLDPPNIIKAEVFSNEIARRSPSAYNMWQAAMMLYYVAHEPHRTVVRLEDAIARARMENDDRVLYSALSLLGQAVLDLRQSERALDILKEIEQMILDRKPLVPGDETCFLESAHAHGVGLPFVRRIAVILARSCRDREFERRLRALAFSDHSASQ